MAVSNKIFFDVTAVSETLLFQMEPTAEEKAELAEDLAKLKAFLEQEEHENALHSVTTCNFHIQLWLFKVLQKRPSDAILIKASVVSLVALGKYEDCITLINKSENILNDPEIKLHYAYCLYKMLKFNHVDDLLVEAGKMLNNRHEDAFIFLKAQMVPFNLSLI
jgi:hypothetical protein